MIQITLDLYDVTDLLQDALRKKFGAELKLNLYESGLTHYERIDKIKKHKNGKIVKNEHGDPVKEFVEYKKKYIHLDEGCEMSFYLEESD